MNHYLRPFLFLDQSITLRFSYRTNKKGFSSQCKVSGSDQRMKAECFFLRVKEISRDIILIRESVPFAAISADCPIFNDLLNFPVRASDLIPAC